MRKLLPRRNVAWLVSLLGFGMGFSIGRLCAGEPPTLEKIVQAVKDLGDDRFTAREQASQFLWKAGAAAEPALAKAAQSNDLEVKRRAKEILERFQYGIYPETPQHLADLVQQFRAGDRNGRALAVKKLLESDQPGYRIVVRIAAAEQEADARRQWNQLLRQETPRLVAKLLHQGKLDDVENLLEQAVERREDSKLPEDTSIPRNADLADTCVRDYAAFLLLRGTLAMKIAQRSVGPDAHAPRNAQVLAYLHRANGDRASAFRFAEKSGDRGLQYWLLVEQGKWGEILERYPPRTVMKGSHEIEILGYEAAFQRLAGRKDPFQKTVTQLCNFAVKRTEDSSEGWYVAEALLINLRPQEAVDVLIREKNFVYAFDLLRHQRRFREALALADKVQGEMTKTTQRLAFERACLLYEVGEKEKALPLLTKMGERFKSDKEDWELTAMVEREMGLGLKDIALEHTAIYLARPNLSNHRLVLYRLFGERSGRADMWWLCLRSQFPMHDNLAVLKRVRAIVEGTMEGDAFRPLIAAAAGWISDAKRTDEEREKLLLVLGDSCRTMGFEKEAVQHYEEASEGAASPAPLVRLADILTDKKEWMRAADLYGRAWEKDRTKPAPLFLQGWALTQAGQKEAGERRMTLAHWLPLADAERRYVFVEELTRRGLKEWMLRESDMTERTGDFDDWYTNNARREMGFAAANDSRLLEAADRREWSILHCLEFSTGYMHRSAYLSIPHEIYGQRARGLLAEGKRDEALRAIHTSLTMLPASGGPVIELTPLLHKAGHEQDAERLFAGLFATYEQLCADFPRCAFAHNELAWLAACCRRQLDKALSHAETAVKLAPESASYLDTLAEVHFQRGDQAKAIEFMRRCIEREPRRAYFVQQLKRFEAGDRFADVPPER
jgi:tetratricopeptide (TPR) repeat protein